jgi:LytS/YehU family sensor histidine kinase
MEELRFNQSFRYTIKIDDQLNSRKVMIPSMLIQPLAENAIWHGLMHKQGDKQLHISFSCDKGQLTCVVEDNGIGIKPPENGGPPKAYRQTGLDNIRQRLELLNKKFNLSGSMVIYDLKDGNGKTGTKIKVVYPVLPE